MIRGHSQNIQKCTPFYHRQPPKIHFGGCHWLSGNSILMKGEIVPNGKSSLSMTASKMYFWRLSMIKWCALLYILRMASNHVLGCSWGHTWLIWMKFSENVGIIPIKICNFLQFLFSWTHEPQIQIQIVWKLCCHPVVGKNATNNFWKIFESSGHSAYTFKPPRNVICKNVIYSKKK